MVERGSQKTQTPDGKLWWLLAGRLAAAVLLFLTSALWIHSSLSDAYRGLWKGTLPIFIAWVLLSAFYAIVLRFDKHYKEQAIVQLSFDVLLTTWLVWATGDIQSPYIIIYLVIISIASIFIGPRGALLTALGCAFVFTSVTLPISLGWISRFAGAADYPSFIKPIQSIALNDVAFFIVGLLAKQLAERQSRSDVELIATTQTLANLRALHERIVESIRSGLVTTDLEGRIFTFNTTAEEITGYKAEDVKGKHISKLFGEIQLQIQESLSAAEVGELSPRFESECLTPEGLRLRLGFSISPLFTESGETTGLILSFQDLTDIRSMEETARRQDRLAAVGRVAAGIAHEIRNPLAAMRGAIQVLQSDLNGDASQAQLMGIILNESDRLNKIITDFLTYARPRLSEFETVDVCEAMRETFTLLKHSPELRENHVLEEVLPKEQITTLADSSQLKQVFWNLSRNAIQAMPDGGTLRAEVTKRRSGRIQITFTDTGCGMSPQQVERLFEPFSSTKGSTGLGLSIVYQIVRDHGGTINVRSREGQGTTITIELPSASKQ